MSYVVFEHIGKTYHDSRRQTDFVALENVSLSLERQELLCLLGPSGCGKSTLLNMLAGFEHPTSGQLRIGDKHIDAPGADRGMVFQQPTLMPWLTVAENIAFPLKLRGQNKAQRREMAQPYIDMVGLTGFENHYPSELSGGMSQRVGIARALLLKPGVILMDEPFAALDAQTKEQLQEELVSIWQQSGATIIFVTHSVEEALILGTQVAVMTRGPGRIQELMPIDLPRPRDSTAPRFNEIKRHVLELIRTQATPPVAA